MEEGFDEQAELDARAKQQEAAELRRVTEETDIQWLMKHQQGRRVMWRLLSVTGVYQSTFKGEDTHSSAFAEGERNVGLRFLSELQRLSPNESHMMIQEHR